MWTGVRYPKITQAEYHEFHSVDRELYATLVYDLWRDPIEAIQMMAIWIWLERVIMDSPALTRMILTNFSSQWIDQIGDEALLCWDNLGLLFSSSSMDFPLTNKLLKKEMPIEFFCKNREASIVGINEVITNVCATCLKDIWDGAIARNAYMEFLQCMTNHETMVVPRKTKIIQPDERTLFVTFSRGYPVLEWEVREFLTQIFGECIEAFYMQEVPKGEHALFAKIVLYHTSYIHAILCDGTTAKFTINGKPLWMRKFIPKRQRR
uniref:uncharacterized protein LOC122608890 n=1 Tax=Erigeron canadensis TaxID=72917 RepID=UPI001CB92815|nr:uncharacterized protein LOC122608890 [Erigeron canadensis]